MKSISLSTGHPGPARALSRARWPRRSVTGTSTRARCTGRLDGRRIHQGVALDDEASVAGIASRAAIVVEGGVVSIDGHDVTRAIRTPEIDKAAASVARLPRVRDVLVARQRALGEDGGVVMEGRDIGTVVFPNADVKVYLDASAEERARRRANDPAHTGSQVGQAAVAAAIQARDTRTRPARCHPSRSPPTRYTSTRRRCRSRRSSSACWPSCDPELTPSELKKE